MQTSFLPNTSNLGIRNWCKLGKRLMQILVAGVQVGYLLNGGILGKGSGYK